MKPPVSKPVDTEKQSADYEKENQTVSRATYAPLLIFLCIAAAVAIIRLCQEFVPAQDNTKAAIEALLGLLTLIVIVVQSVIIKWQWKAMQDALEHGERAMMYGQAAYIVVTGGSVVQCTPDTKAIAEIQIINAGQTPAYNLKTVCHIGWRKLSHYATRPQMERGLHPEGSILGPNCTRTLRPESKDAVPADIMAGYIADGEFLFVFGLVTYNDIFKRTRWTTFSYFCRERDGRTLSSAIYGNRADDEDRN